MSAGSAVANHIGAANAAAANKRQAEEAYRQSLKDIGLMQQGEQERTALTLFQAVRQARRNRSLAAVAAGEAGLAGASVDLLLGDIDAQLAEFSVVERRNTDRMITQLQREKVSQRTVMQNRVANSPTPNVFATGLQIAGIGLDFAAGRKANSPT